MLTMQTFHTRLFQMTEEDQSHLQRLAQLTHSDQMQMAALKSVDGWTGWEAEEAQADDQGHVDSDE
jgi:hypothetical protein